MNRPLKMGDRVKLTARGLRLTTRRWSKIDWPNRHGQIVRLNARREGYVLWDGRKTADAEPLVMLERADQ